MRTHIYRTIPQLSNGGGSSRSAWKSLSWSNFWCLTSTFRSLFQVFPCTLNHSHSLSLFPFLCSLLPFGISLFYDYCATIEKPKVILSHPGSTIIIAMDSKQWELKMKIPWTRVKFLVLFSYAVVDSKKSMEMLINNVENFVEFFSVNFSRLLINLIFAASVANFFVRSLIFWAKYIVPARFHSWLMPPSIKCEITTWINTNANTKKMTKKSWM